MACAGSLCRRPRRLLRRRLRRPLRRRLKKPRLFWRLRRRLIRTLRWRLQEADAPFLTPELRIEVQSPDLRQRWLPELLEALENLMKLMALERR